MSRPALEVADIFRDHGAAWRLANAGHVSLDQLKVMSAIERHRAAALDRTHDLQLVEADVSGIGQTPRRPVVAEDIRDLQRWTGHGRGPLRRRLVFPALLGLFARLRQQVERALDAGDHAGGDARVARRGCLLYTSDAADDLLCV